MLRHWQIRHQVRMLVADRLLKAAMCRSVSQRLLYLLLANRATGRGRILLDPRKPTARAS